VYHPHTFFVVFSSSLPPPVICSSLLTPPHSPLLSFPLLIPFLSFSGNWSEERFAREFELTDTSPLTPVKPIDMPTASTASEQFTQVASQPNTNTRNMIIPKAARDSGNGLIAGNYGQDPGPAVTTYSGSFAAGSPQAKTADRPLLRKKQQQWAQDKLQESGAAGVKTTSQQSYSAAAAAAAAAKSDSHLRANHAFSRQFIKGKSLGLRK
jgi:hypothetical protein